MARLDGMDGMDGREGEAIACLEIPWLWLVVSQEGGEAQNATYLGQRHQDLGSCSMRAGIVKTSAIYIYALFELNKGRRYIRSCRYILSKSGQVHRREHRSRFAGHRQLIVTSLLNSQNPNFVPCLFPRSRFRNSASFVCFLPSSLPFPGFETCQNTTHVSVHRQQGW
jgi:hypothetical protein